MLAAQHKRRLVRAIAINTREEAKAAQCTDTRCRRQTATAKVGRMRKISGKQHITAGRADRKQRCHRARLARITIGSVRANLSAAVVADQYRVASALGLYRRSLEDERLRVLDTDEHATLRIRR